MESWRLIETGMAVLSSSSLTTARSYINVHLMDPWALQCTYTETDGGDTVRARLNAIFKVPGSIPGPTCLIKVLSVFLNQYGKC